MLGLKTPILIKNIYAYRQSIFISGGIVVGGCLILMLGSIWWINRQTAHRIITDISQLSGSQVGLVFGTAEYTADGRKNLYFLYRIQAAVALREAQKIGYFLVSGDNGSKNYDEPSAFKQALVKGGVPEDRIVLDYAGFSTLDSVIRAQQVFGVEQMTLITQPDQAQRGLMICDTYGIQCDAYAAQDVSIAIAPRVMIRERFAKVKVILDLYVWNAQPRYIGMQEQVPRKPAKESIQLGQEDN